MRFRADWRMEQRKERYRSSPHSFQNGCLMLINTRPSTGRTQVRPVIRKLSSAQYVAFYRNTCHTLINVYIHICITWQWAVHSLHTFLYTIPCGILFEFTKSRMKFQERYNLFAEPNEMPRSVSVSSLANTSSHIMAPTTFIKESPTQ